MIFTSGATEANNLAVLGLARGAVIASQLEHPCVIEPLHAARSARASRSSGCRWMRGAWLIVGHSLREATSPLVCLMLANHETGAIQPVRDIALSLPPGVALHCDAAQAVGKIPVNFRELGATTLSASAHKFGGPKGIGVLVVKRGTKLQPLTFGGHQQRGRRPGTEPVALAVGMAAALESCIDDLAANHAKLEALRERFWMRLKERRGAGGAQRPRDRRGGRGANDAQRLLPRLPGRSFADGARPGRRRLLDRLGLFEWLTSTQSGPARDGRAGRNPPLRASLQHFPSHRAGDPGRGGGVYRGGGEKRTGEHRDQGISDFARVPGLLVEDGSL